MGWPDLTYRSRLEPQLRNELDQLVSLIIGWNAAEHGPDGQHTTITVDGIQFRNGDGTVIATITVVNGQIVITYTPQPAPPGGAPPDPPGIALPAPAQIGDVLVAHHHGIPGGTFSTNAGIDLNTDAPPDLGGKWLIGVGRDALAEALIFANYAAAGNVGEGIGLYWLGPPTGYMLSPPAAGSLLGYYLGSNSDTRLRWTGIYGLSIDALNGFKERGRALGMGEWAQEPYNPANFTGSGGMVVTVDAPDQIDYGYTLIGKTMIVTFYLAPISVSAPFGPTIDIKIPAGQIAARAINAVMATIIDGGGAATGLCFVDASGTVIHVQKSNGTPWLASVNNTYLLGQITFPIL